MADIIDTAEENEARDRALAIVHAREALSVEGADYCIDCGTPIEAARRAALPSAMRCVHCQEAIERRAYLGKCS